jgi:hypothetical protein
MERVMMIKKMLKAPDPKETIKLSLTMLASGTIWFYTGPIASIAARKSFQLGYDLLYGIPHWYNPSYTLTYMPLREHVCHYAYEYGGLMLGSLCAPLIYKGINTASHLGGEIFSCLGRKTSSDSEEVLDRRAPMLQFSTGSILPENHRLDPKIIGSSSKPNLRL